MAVKASVLTAFLIEKDDHDFYTCCPELKRCQCRDKTLQEAISNIKEAIELCLDTMPVDERKALVSREILTTPQR